MAAGSERWIKSIGCKEERNRSALVRCTEGLDNREYWVTRPSDITPPNGIAKLTVAAGSERRIKTIECKGKHGIDAISENPQKKHLS